MIFITRKKMLRFEVLYGINLAERQESAREVSKYWSSMTASWPSRRSSWGSWRSSWTWAMPPSARSARRRGATGSGGFGISCCRYTSDSPRRRLHWNPARGTCCSDEGVCVGRLGNRRKRNVARRKQLLREMAHGNKRLHISIEVAKLIDCTCN